MENERFMITIYVFRFPLVLKDSSMNGKDLKINGLFLLSRDSLIVWTTIMENECFMITLYVFLFPLELKDYSMNRKDSSNL